MKKLIIISLVLLVSLPASAAGPAVLTLSPAQGEFKVGQTFNLNVIADPKGETIDTVRAKIIFPPDKLEIQKFAFGSLYSFPSGGNGYDNKSGLLSQAAGAPGGTNQKGVFGIITFKVKAPGPAKITLDSSSLMLSMGVNKFSGQGFQVSYNLVAPVSAPVPTPAPAAAPTPVPTPAPAATPQEPTQAPAQSKPVSVPKSTKTNAVPKTDKISPKELSSRPPIEEVFTMEMKDNTIKWLAALILTALTFGVVGYVLGMRGWPTYLVSRLASKKPKRGRKKNHSWQTFQKKLFKYLNELKAKTNL